MERLKSVKMVCKGIFLSLLITLVLLGVFSAILAYTPIPESSIPWGVHFIHSISILLCSTLVGKSLGKNGLKLGIIISTTYVLVLLLMRNWFSGDTYHQIPYLWFLFYELVGLIGGVLGVNLNAKK